MAVIYMYLKPGEIMKTLYTVPHHKKIPLQPVKK